MSGINVNMHEDSTEPRAGCISVSVNKLKDFVVLRFYRAGAGEIELYLHHPETAKLIAEVATEAHIALGKKVKEEQK